MPNQFFKLLFSNGWLATLGAVLIGTITNGIYELIKQNFVTGVFLTIIAFVIAYSMYRIKKDESRLFIDEGKDIPKTEHIISGLSFLNCKIEEETSAKISNIRLIFNLIEKHHPMLQHLHLIVSNVEGVSASKTELLKWYEHNNHRYEIKDISVGDGYEIGEVYKKVNLYLRELEEQGINLRTQVLIDITAGTAAISVGLTIAALANGCNISYQATRRIQGDNLTGTTSWQFYRNRIIQIWEEYPAEERL